MICRSKYLTDRENSPPQGMIKYPNSAQQNASIAHVLNDEFPT
jgi:hypothetical protein